MNQLCNAGECAEAAISEAEDQALCRKHFLLHSYKRLEAISAQIHESEFHDRHSDAASHFLEGCMRDAADIACGDDAPGNLERAQVLDVLLWASELHGRLRRGPRVPARIPIQLRSEDPEHPWEEDTETHLVSRHGAQVICTHELNANDKVTCVRLDNQWRAEARVAWTSRKASGMHEAGLEFLTDNNFWGLGSGASAGHLKTVRDDAAGAGARRRGRSREV